MVVPQCCMRSPSFSMSNRPWTITKYKIKLASAACNNNAAQKTVRKTMEPAKARWCPGEIHSQILEIQPWARRTNRRKASRPTSSKSTSRWKRTINKKFQTRNRQAKAGMTKWGYNRTWNNKVSSICKWESYRRKEHCWVYQTKYRLRAITNHQSRKPTPNLICLCPLNSNLSADTIF